MKIKILSIILILLVGIFAFATRDRTVGAMNMAPTLMKGDKVSVPVFSSFSYEPKRWDVVIYKTLDGSYYIGRIIGLPLEKVKISEGGIFINGNRTHIPAHLKESGIRYYSASELAPKGESASKSHTMAQSQYFIVGDNSQNSFDSRYFGGVERARIINRVAKVGT